MSPDTDTLNHVLKHELDDCNSSTKVVYAALLAAQKPLTSREVARRASLSVQWTRKALGKLRRRGLVERTKAEGNDPRSVHYMLSH